jgi:hypothetical protein
MLLSQGWLGDMGAIRSWGLISLGLRLARDQAGAPDVSELPPCTGAR